MKTLLLALLTATPSAVWAGKYYDLTQNVSSATLRVGLSGANPADAVLVSSGAAVVQSTSATSGHKPFKVKNNAGTEVLSVTQGGTTAGTFSGNLTGSASNNVLKAGDTMTGALTVQSSVDATSMTIRNGASDTFYRVDAAATKVAGIVISKDGADKWTQKVLAGAGDDNLWFVSGTDPKLKMTSGVGGAAIFMSDIEASNATGATGNISASGSITASSVTSLGGISASTVTVTGTGSKCFSVDDPTFVVDCNLNVVGIGGVPESNTDLYILKASPRITMQSSVTGEDFSFNKSQTAGGGVNWQSNNGGSNLGAFLDNGYVGIGTVSPATKFHMSSGTLTVDGTGAGITTTGSMTALSQPYVSCTKSDQIITNGAWNTLYFTAPSAGDDPRSMYGGAASSGTFTAPEAGRYMIACGVQYSITTSGTSRIQLLLDGSPVTTNPSAYYQVGATGVVYPQTTMVQAMTAGQTIQCQNYQDELGGGSKHPTITAGFFWMVKLF